MGFVFIAGRLVKMVLNLSIIIPMFLSGLAILIGVFLLPSNPSLGFTSIIIGFFGYRFTDKKAIELDKGLITNA